MNQDRGSKRQMSNGNGNTSVERRPPLDIPKTAEYAGTSVRHIRRLVGKRLLASHRLGGKVLIFPDDVDHLLEAGKREAAE